MAESPARKAASTSPATRAWAASSPVSIQQGGGLFVDVIGLEQLHGQGVRAAAFGAHCQPLAANWAMMSMGSLPR